MSIAMEVSFDLRSMASRAACSNNLCGFRGGRQELDALPTHFDVIYDRVFFSKHDSPDVDKDANRDGNGDVGVKTADGEDDV